MEQVANVRNMTAIDAMSDAEVAGSSHMNLSAIADAENLATELYHPLTPQKSFCDYILMAVQIASVLFITPFVVCACVLVIPFYIAEYFAERTYDYCYYEKNIHMFNSLCLAGLASIFGFFVGPLAGLAGSFFVSSTMVKNILNSKPVLNEINLFGDIDEDVTSFSDTETISTIEGDNIIP